MQCKCGCDAKHSEAVKSKLKAKLEFQVCTACNRVSSGELYINGVMVAEDVGGEPLARQLFDVLDAKSASQLYVTAQSYLTTERQELLPVAYQQTSLF